MDEEAMMASPNGRRTKRTRYRMLLENHGEVGDQKQTQLLEPIWPPRYPGRREAPFVAIPGIETPPPGVTEGTPPVILPLRGGLGWPIIPSAVYSLPQAAFERRLGNNAGRTIPGGTTGDASFRLAGRT
jgi:hypothetical protein